MNKILIHKGDCTIFANVRKFLTFNVETELDLTGWTAKFTLGWVTKEIADISAKSFEIVLGAEDTKQLKLGSQFGSIVLTDAEGNIKTVTNTIPFEVTNEVVENQYQEIDLTIPQSSGVDVKLKVGMSTVTSINGMTGDVTIDIPDISGLATKEELSTKQDKGDYALASDIPTQVSQLENDSDYATQTELTNGLATKQAKGDYALVDDVPTLVSELENDSNYATQTQVMQAIASIPQFKLSIVEALPTTGEKMTLYLVSKGTESPDVYDEYIWIEETSSFEFLGTTAVDLTDYVKNTDYPTATASGVVKLGSTSFGVTQYNGYLQGYTATLEKYNETNNPFIVCKGTLENIKNNYVKEAITTNDIELTDDEKTSARTWLGAVGNTDYATSSKGGVIVSSGSYGAVISQSTGYLYSPTKTLSEYNSMPTSSFIGKGTLNNVLAQYSKTVLTTEADYEALVEADTVDSNTLYLIEEE